MFGLSNATSKKVGKRKENIKSIQGFRPIKIKYNREVVKFVSLNPKIWHRLFILTITEIRKV